MIARDCRPRHPPDGTVRADRRSRDRFCPAPPGRPKKLSDAELACLAVAQVLLGARSEHHWLRLCYGRLGHLFPYLPRQPGYHKRLKAAAPLLAKVMDYLAREVPSWHDPVRLIDATPVPCGASRETVRRSELAGWAHYGRCAAHSRWYWGLKLYLITTLRDARGVVPARPEARRTRGRRGTAGAGPAGPRTARRPHHRGPVRPDHPAAAGHGRLHLAQLGHRTTRQAVADRLRQLTP